MIDIHSHIIPEIDDGADSMETAIRMLEIAGQEETETIIATPHFYRGRFETSYALLKDLVDKIKAQFDKEGPEILIGQEIFIDKYTLELYKKGEIGTLNASRYMLIEFPFDKAENNTLDIIYELRLLGIVPVIAHPERYDFIMKKPSAINEYVDEGCLFQINTTSIEGLFGKEVKNTAELLIKNGCCSFIASDAHTSGKRCPGIKKSLNLIEKQVSGLSGRLIENARNLISDSDMEFLPERINPKKGIFDFFRK